MGRAYIAWEENDLSVFLEHIDENGVKLWSQSGTVFSAQGNSIQLISDGSGGAIMVWFGNFSIKAQRFTSNGTKLWGENNLICSESGIVNRAPFESATSDGAGGVIIAWQQNTANSYDILAQRVNSSGSLLWNRDGLNISSVKGNQIYANISSDGSGGALVSWQDARNGSINEAGDDTYAQKINSSGIPQWTENGVAISKAVGQQIFPQIVSDGNGGAYISWSDNRMGQTLSNPYSLYNVYAQHLNSLGLIQWELNGKLIDGESYKKLTNIIGDQNGGMILVWSDKVDTFNGIRAQRIDSDGSLQWAKGGIIIAPTTYSISLDVEIKSDGNNGYVLAWADARNGKKDIYAQAITNDGMLKWQDEGIVVCNSLGVHIAPKLALNEIGGFIVAWADSRNGTYDIYASRVSSSGSLPVTLISFKGVYENGKSVLSWKTTNEINNRGFEVQRSINAAEFEKIGYIDGNGDTSDGINKYYSFKDDNPNVGVNYYRLKQIDYDGKYSFSQIKSVDNTTQILFIYPNPTVNTLTINTQGYQGIFKIINSNGRLMKTRMITNFKTEIDVADLQPGSYIFNISGKSIRFIKN